MQTPNPLKQAQTQHAKTFTRNTSFIGLTQTSKNQKHKKSDQQKRKQSNNKRLNQGP